MAFTSVIQGTNVTVDLKLLTMHWNKRDNGAMCTGKEIISGLKLALMETDVATRLLRKNLNIGISVLSFVNFCEIKVCPKTWAYFTLKLGWLKTYAGTKILPQNTMYLSALVLLGNSLL